MYSSVKVNGRKLYEYVRNNETVEHPRRQAFTKDIHRIPEATFQEQACHSEVEVICGKGTHTRTLATDIGFKLGLSVHVSHLTRIASGGFQLENSLTVDQIKELHEHDSSHSESFPIEYGLKSLRSFRVKDPNLKKETCNGQKFHKKALGQDAKELLIFVDSNTQKVLAIYIAHLDRPYKIKPKKALN